MPQFPDFIPAKRPGEPNFTQAAIYQGAGDRARYEQELAQREQQLRGPVDAYKGYVNLTDHNPLAEQVRKWRGKAPTEETHIPGMNTAKDAAETAMAPTGMQTSNTVASLGGGGLNAGSNAGVKALSMTDPVAAGNQLSTMLPASTEVAGNAALGAAGGAATGGALSALMESQQPGTSNERIAVKGAGGASTGALMASAAPLAAAGPGGWAAIAGLAAMSLYGMLV